MCVYIYMFVSSTKLDALGIFNWSTVYCTCLETMEMLCKTQTLTLS